MNKYLFKYLIHSGMLLFGPLLMGQSPGTPDLSFGAQGVTVHTLNEVDDVKDLVVRNDDYIVVLGVSDSLNRGLPDYTLTRYFPDGTLDTDFGNNGSTTGDFDTFPYSMPNTLVEQDDGKLLVLGEGRTTGSHKGALCLLRFDADGHPDPAFANNGTRCFYFLSNEESPRSMVLQNDGKIVVAGASFDSGTVHVEYPAIARLMPDGSFDTTFGSTGKVALDFGLGIFDVRRFGSGANVRHTNGGFINHITVLSDGKLLCAGSFYNGFTYQCMLFRLHPDGTLDESIGSGGVLTFNLSPGNKNRITGGIKLNDDRVMYRAALSAQFGDNNIHLIGFAPNNQLTPLQEWDIHHQFDFSEDLVMPPNNRPVVVGRSIHPDSVNSGHRSDYFGIFRLKPTGTGWVMDPHFANNGADTIRVFQNNRCGARAVGVQSDGKIIVAGYTQTDGAGVHQNLALIRLYGNIADGMAPSSTSDPVLVWPNPAHTALYFSPLHPNEKPDWAIFDLQGQLVAKNHSGPLPPDRKIDIAFLPSGIYVLHLRSASGKQQHLRFIKS